MASDNRDMLTRSFGNDFNLGNLRPLIASNCAEYAAVFCNGQVNEVHQLSELVLSDRFMWVMMRMGINRMRRIQCYAWPHLIRGSGYGAMFVGGPRSGRTFGYILPLCFKVAQAGETVLNRPLVGRMVGALALVIVPDMERVNSVTQICRDMLRLSHLDESIQPVLNVPSGNNEGDFMRALIMGVGVLVATAVQMEWVENTLMPDCNFNNLIFVAFDDVDMLPPEHLQIAKTALDKLSPIVGMPQVVMVTQTCRTSLVKQLKKMNNITAIIFSDLLEAALYGGVELSFKIDAASTKIDTVCQILSSRSPNHFRTVIFCNNEVEIGQVLTTLQANGLDCLPIYQNSDETTYWQLQDWVENYQKSVIICTDMCPEMDMVRNVHTVIHFAISETWSQFKGRHLCFFDNMKNNQCSTVNKVPLDNGNQRLKTFILLDETNEMQLPRMIGFISEKIKVDDKILELAKKTRKQMEEVSHKERLLCENMYIMGKCLKLSCPKRHHLICSEVRPSYIPASGDIKIKIVKVFSPTHFSVQILEHMPLQGTWKPHYKDPGTLLYDQWVLEDDLTPYWPPIRGDICLFWKDRKAERVRVLKVDEIKDYNVSSRRLKVIVQAMDRDSRIVVTCSGNLYMCPADIKEFPPLCVDLRVMGLIPFTGDSAWSNADLGAWVQSLYDLPADHFLQAKVKLANINTIFVDNVVAIMEAKSMKIFVQLTSVKTILLEKGLAKLCTTFITPVLEFFQENPKDLTDDKSHLENNPEPESYLNAISKKLESEEETVLEDSLHSIKDAGEFNTIDSVTDIESVGKDAPFDERDGLAKDKDNSKGFDEFIECLKACLELDEIEREEDRQAAHLDMPPLTPIVPANQTNEDGSLSSASGSEADSYSDLTKIEREEERNAMHLDMPPLTPIVPASQAEGDKTDHKITSEHIHPEVKFSQSFICVDFKVLMPEEGFLCAVNLIENVLYTLCTYENSSDIYSFALNLNFAYLYMIHNIKGRTLYIKVYKLHHDLVPLSFPGQKFVKPDYDKMEVESYEHVNNLYAEIDHPDGTDYYDNNYDTPEDDDDEFNDLMEKLEFD
ncbi:hypothetical protein KR018_000951 [Drosophila ironensis]|nr:hypothetical protein KR018_000951 [Drosophila ironensis]